MKNQQKPRRWGTLLLFFTVPTLICCALPILLISLGFGATVASLYGQQLPFLQWFGLNSVITFSVSGIILLVSGLILFKDNRSCPADPELAIACVQARRWNVYFWSFSLIIWGIGALTAFVLPHFI